MLWFTCSYIQSYDSQTDDAVRRLFEVCPSLTFVVDNCPRAEWYFDNRTTQSLMTFPRAEAYFYDRTTARLITYPHKDYSHLCEILNIPNWYHSYNEILALYLSLICWTKIWRFKIWNKDKSYEIVCEFWHWQDLERLFCTVNSSNATTMMLKSAECRHGLSSCNRAAASKSYRMWDVCSSGHPSPIQVRKFYLGKYA